MNQQTKNRCEKIHKFGKIKLILLCMLYYEVAYIILYFFIECYLLKKAFCLRSFIIMQTGFLIMGIISGIVLWKSSEKQYQINIKTNKNIK